MSRWIHIRGGLELVSEAFEYRKRAGKETPYYVDPEKQVRLTAPEPAWGRENGLSITMIQYSLPRAKKYIDKAFKMLPQGEIGVRYSIKQDDWDFTTGCSTFEYECQKEAYKAALEKMYSRQTWGPMKYKSLKNDFNVELYDINYVDHMVLGVREDLRDCSGKEMLEALEECFAYLEKNRISIEDGYLEWQDDDEPDNMYSWRVSRVGPDYKVHHMFVVTSIQTNKILYKKTYKYKVDEKGSIDYMAKGYDIVEENFGYEPWEPAPCESSGSESEE